MSHWHSRLPGGMQAQGLRRRPMQAWVSCSGGRTTACDPHALCGDQCGEQRAPTLSTAQQQMEERLENEYLPTKRASTNPRRRLRCGEDSSFLANLSHYLRRAWCQTCGSPELRYGPRGRLTARCKSGQSAACWPWTLAHWHVSHKACWIVLAGSRTASPILRGYRMAGLWQLMYSFSGHRCARHRCLFVIKEDRDASKSARTGVRQRLRSCSSLSPQTCSSTLVTCFPLSGSSCLHRHGKSCPEWPIRVSHHRDGAHCAERLFY